MIFSNSSIVKKKEKKSEIIIAIKCDNKLYETSAWAHTVLKKSCTDPRLTGTCTRITLTVSVLGLLERGTKVWKRKINNIDCINKTRKSIFLN